MTTMPMRRILGVVPVLATMIVLAAGCGGGQDPSRNDGLKPGRGVTGAPAIELHNDAFPCNLATQSEIATLVGTPVEYDAIEPDGQSCVYMLVGPGAMHVDIDVFTDEDKAHWTATNQDYPAWATNPEIGGKAVPGLGDDAFLSELPGYIAQLDIWKAKRLVRISMDVSERFVDADADRLISLGHAVAGRM